MNPSISHSSERTYEITDFEGFFRSWTGDGHYAKNPLVIDSEYIRYGRVCSDLETATGPIGVPHDKVFWDLIEAGVKPLVRVLIEEYGLITFCSCAGHPHKSVEGEYRDGRFVKILFRNSLEQNAFGAIARLIEGFQDPDAYIFLKVHLYKDQFWMASEKKEEIFSCCQLSLESRDSGVAQYFSEVDAATHNLIEALEALLLVYKKYVHGKD